MNSQLNSEQNYISAMIQDKEGQKCEKQFEKGQKLRQTQLGDFYQFTNIQSQEIIIAKIIPKSKITSIKVKQQVLQEIRIYQKIEHKNIIRFYGTFEDKEFLYILLEEFQYTLYDYLKQNKNLSEQKVIQFIIQIVDALNYLHDNNIIHRDLKLSNIYITKDQQIKVGEFNFAIKLEEREERRKTICGTSKYIAPEILNNENGYSFQVDIWYLGVILYLLLIGVHPFEAGDLSTAYQNIKANQYNLKDEMKISQNLRVLIQESLNADPNQRPSIDRIRELLK